MIATRGRTARRPSAPAPVVAARPFRGEGPSPGADRPVSPRWIGWLAVAAVGALPVVEAVRIVAQRSHVVLNGDQALLELGARRAAHLDQLVGPYSRVGFHQPGPVLFYLLAPFVRILGPGGPGLYLGAIAISGAALIATVAFLWRHLGPVAALWAAMAIDVYCLCLRVGTLREPWNPYLVAAPMVLFVVLWAAAITGSPGAGVWAVVIGSYEVQTHIATAGFVITMWAILAGWAVVRARRRHRVGAIGPHWWSPARITGVVALALMWLPPVVELWRDRPNNLSLLWDFFTTPQATPPFAESLRSAANALTIVPFGYHDYVLTLNRSGTELAIGTALMVVGLIVAVALGWRRRQPFSLALAAGAVLGVVLGVISLSRTAGPAYLYFAVWLAYVPLSLALAIGVALLTPAHPTRRSWAGLGRPILALSVAAAIGVAAVTVRSDLRMGPVKTITTGAGPWPAGTAPTPQARSRSLRDTAALTTAARSVLRPSDRWVGFTVATSSLWPYVAGMVLELDESGIQSTVSPASWELYFGHERAPGRPVDVQFELVAATDQAPTGTVLARVDGAVLTYQRTGG